MNYAKPSELPSGMTATSRWAGDFLLSDVRFEPGFKSQRHSHEQAYFCIALRGSCSEKVSTHTWEYSPMWLEYLPAGEPHSLQCHKAGTQSFMVQIPASAIARVREYSCAMPGPMHCNGASLARLLLKTHQEFLQMDQASPLAIEGLVFELLAEALRAELRKCDRTPPRWLDQARDLIHANFADRLSLALISETVDIHPVHLSREFRKHFRCTVGEYIRRLRIEHACLEVASTDLPFVEIAISAGFSDQSHFGRTFKRIAGMTPAEYRHSANPGKNPSREPLFITTKSAGDF